MAMKVRLKKDSGYADMTICDGGRLITIAQDWIEIPDTIHKYKELEIEGQITAPTEVPKEVPKAQPYTPSIILRKKKKGLR